MSFIVNLSQQNKRVNSTKSVGGGVALTCDLKSECSFTNPSFVIHGTQEIPYSYNYIEVPLWGVKYFVEDWTWDDTNWTAHCRLDVLGSYRQNIFQKYALAVYSTSHGSTNIVDGRFTAKSRPSTRLLSSATILSGSTTYVVRTIGKNGGIVGYVMSEQQFNNFSAALGSALTFDTTLQMQYADALGCVAGAMVYPFSVPTEGNQITVYLGDYSTGVGARYAVTYENGTISITKGTIFGDWRDSVFVDYKLYLPYIGVVDLASSDVGQATGLDIDWTIDYVTGSIRYEVWMSSAGGARVMIANYAGQCGASVPVTGYSGNAINALNGIGQAVSGAMEAVGSAVMAGATGGASAALEAGMGTLGSGAVGDIIGGVVSAGMAYHTKTASIIGGSTGMAYRGGDARTVRFYATVFDTNMEPDDMAAIGGYPADTIVKVGDCSGYLQTSGFSVEGNIPFEAKKAINQLMDNGVYIE